MIKRDERYTIVRTMFDAGHVASFSDIFKYIPKTVVANDLGKKVDRFNKLMEKVERFTLEEIYMIGNFLGLTEEQIYELVRAEYVSSKGRIKRTKRS
ncbi:MAG: hypothetical protein JST42_28685 [Bacteroidetes bacterium]|nr:hypothetical protein [Bacteroidota bacterium]